MKQYIDKATVVAEINSMLKSVEHTSHCDEASFNSGRWKALTSIKKFIATLEVKEVDLDKELDFVKDAYYYFTSDERSAMKKVAKHFFELGIQQKVQKGE